MKKFKLLTSLSLLGTVGVAAPMVVTACSSDKSIEIDHSADVNCTAYEDRLCTYSSQLEAQTKFTVKDKSNLTWSLDPGYDLISIDPQTGVLTVEEGFTGYFLVKIIAKDSDGKEVATREYGISAECFHPVYDISAGSYTYSWVNERNMKISKGIGTGTFDITCVTDNNIKLDDVKTLSGQVAPSYISVDKTNPNKPKLVINVASATAESEAALLLYWKGPNDITYHNALTIKIVA